jgi:thiol-disulfide isomerase/thioredoxin
MRPSYVGLAGLLSAALLAGCSSAHVPKAIAPGPSNVDVSAPSLVKLKAASNIPNCPRSKAAAVDGGLPSVKVACLGGGRSVDLAGLRGPMIVNFWASWCGYCRKEMPALATYARQHPGVRILGVDFLDPQAGNALEFAANSNVAYPLVADPGGDLDRKAPIPHLSGLPFSAFVDASGNVVGREFAVLKTQADISAAVSKYLGVPG